GKSFLDGYERLGQLFLETWKIDAACFERLAECLFQNYQRTWEKRTGSKPTIDVEWRRKVSPLYRGVDVANPPTDFEGCLVVASGRAADHLGVPDRERVEVAGCSVQIGGKDGIEQVHEFIDFGHLRRAFALASKQAAVDFRAEFLRGGALLET